MFSGESETVEQLLKMSWTFINDRFAVLEMDCLLLIFEKGGVKIKITDWKRLGNGQGTYNDDAANA